MHDNTLFEVHRSTTRQDTQNPATAHGSSACDQPETLLILSNCSQRQHTCAATQPRWLQQGPKGA
jgi:hypothetical protein